MTPDLERLVQLQDLDNAIEEARRKIAAHPQRLAEADARLSDATQRVEIVRQRLKDTQEARRALEKEAAVFQGRLTKFKDQLPEVKTNREYQAIQHEMATAQGELGNVEEKVLERMLEADAIAAEVKGAEAALARQQKDIALEKAALEQELMLMQRKLADASSRRASLTEATERRLIALFEQVAKARRGVAISLATRDGSCSVCHVRLRPVVFQMVRQNDQIIQCDSCQRILYYVPPAAPAEAPAAP
ncbi:MAG: zinc ribbon domain-containing protein [Vicinamibacterales bacterium]